MAAVWRRGKSKVNRFLGNAPPETDTTHGLTPLLPYDIVEEITAHLTCDLDTLKACSLTCRSWYLSAASHLHHTLTLTTGGKPGVGCSGLEPLSKLHELGLIPLVKEIQVMQRGSIDCWFTPHAFSHLDLHHFSAFAKVHTLKLQHVQIFRFISDLERYFGHFSPTLRSLALYDPCCTPRHLSHFLSLFPNLDDVEIRNPRAYAPNRPTFDTGLIPFSAPSLRGRLALYQFNWAETWTDLIASCGGVRFRHVVLCGSGSCASVLLGACTETLETLRFNARDSSNRKHLSMYSPMDFS